MTRDIKATREAIWRAVLEYGSIAHLARQLGVAPEELIDWLNGETEIPLEKYEHIVEMVAPLKPEANAKTTPKRRVLVVDDEADAAETLATLLRLMGHDARCITKSKDALEAAKLYGPQIAFLDLQMPQIDGVTLARMFRSDPHLKNVILIALTAHGDAKARRSVRQAGFDAHLLKPAGPELLESIIKQFKPR